MIVNIAFHHYYDRYYDHNISLIIIVIIVISRLSLRTWNIINIIIYAFICFHYLRSLFATTRVVIYHFSITATLSLSSMHASHLRSHEEMARLSLFRLSDYCHFTIFTCNIIIITPIMSRIFLRLINTSLSFHFVHASRCAAGRHFMQAFSFHIIIIFIISSFRHYDENIDAQRVSFFRYHYVTITIRALRAIDHLLTFHISFHHARARHFHASNTSFLSSRSVPSSSLTFRLFTIYLRLWHTHYFNIIICERKDDAGGETRSSYTFIHSYYIIDTGHYDTLYIYHHRLRSYIDHTTLSLSLWALCTIDENIFTW